MSYGTALRLSAPTKRQYIEGVTPDPGGALSMAIVNPPRRFGVLHACVPIRRSPAQRSMPDRENTVAFADTPPQAASVYALIFVLLVPFIMLGMVVGLFWWEERMLPSTERSLTATLMQSTSDLPAAEFPSVEGAERFAAVDGSVLAPSLTDSAEPADFSTATAPSAADPRVISHPAVSGPTRLAYGWPGARRVRSSEPSGSRRRLSHRSYNGHRDHR